MVAFFAGIYTDPQANWWLYAMVFSTILPTALYGIFSLLGAEAFVPALTRRPVAALLCDAPGTPWKSTVAPLAIGALWLIPFLAFEGIGWVLWRVVEELDWQYFTALRDLAHAGRRCGTTTDPHSREEAALKALVVALTKPHQPRLYTHPCRKRTFFNRII